jgi:IPT/TIG domain
MPIEVMNGPADISADGTAIYWCERGTNGSDGTIKKIGTVIVSTPHITSISPTSGPVGTLVTITGSNFGPTQGTSTVTFGATAATVSSWSDTQIQATVPLLSEGPYNVGVQTHEAKSDPVLFDVVKKVQKKPKAKMIYLGVYGSTPPLFGTDWFDPRDYPPYQTVNPFSDVNINNISFDDSILSAIGLQIGALFPTSITFVIGFDLTTLIDKSNIVVDLVKHFYSDGDKVYLAGHSFGGSTVQEAAKKLK